MNDEYKKVLEISNAISSMIDSNCILSRKITETLMSIEPIKAIEIINEIKYHSKIMNDNGFSKEFIDSLTYHPNGRDEMVKVLSSMKVKDIEPDVMKILNENNAWTEEKINELVLDDMYMQELEYNCLVEKYFTCVLNVLSKEYNLQIILTEHENCSWICRLGDYDFDIEFMPVLYKYSSLVEKYNFYLKRVGLDEDNMYKLHNYTKYILRRDNNVQFDYFDRMFDFVSDISLLRKGYYNEYNFYNKNIVWCAIAGSLIGDLYNYVPKSIADEKARIDKKCIENELDAYLDCVRDVGYAMKTIQEVFENKEYLTYTDDLITNYPEDELEDDEYDLCDCDVCHDEYYRYQLIDGKCPKCASGNKTTFTITDKDYLPIIEAISKCTTPYQCNKCNRTFPRNKLSFNELCEDCCGYKIEFEKCCMCGDTFYTYQGELNIYGKCPLCQLKENI